MNTPQRCTVLRRLLPLRYHMRRQHIPGRILQLPTPMHMAPGVTIVNMPVYVARQIVGLKSSNWYMRELASQNIQKLVLINNK